MSDFEAQVKIVKQTLKWLRTQRTKEHNQEEAMRSIRPLATGISYSKGVQTGFTLAIENLKTTLETLLHNIEAAKHVDEFEGDEL